MSSSHYFCFFVVDVRDADVGNYLIDWGGGFLAGMFAKKGKPLFFDGIPEKSEFLSMPEDWDHFGEFSYTNNKQQWGH